MKKKMIISIAAVVVVIGVLLFSIIKCNEKINILSDENRSYDSKINKILKRQQTGVTSYQYDGNDEYIIGRGTPAGTATLVVLDGSGSYFLNNGSENISNSLIGDNDVFKKDNRFKTIIKLKLENGNTLKLLGDDLKVALIYNIVDSEYEN